MELLDTLKLLAVFFAKVLGEHTEIVIHDIKNTGIAHVENGWLTGRNPGHGDDVVALRLLADSAVGNDPPNMRVGYRSATEKGRAIRSSNLFVRDGAGDLRYIFCVNQDLAAAEQAKAQLDELFDIFGLGAIGGFTEAKEPESGADTIEALTIAVILDEIERAKPFSPDSREAKISILRKLNEKGVFEVRNVIPKICDLLQIAQATLYKYLKEIKESDITD